MILGKGCPQCHLSVSPVEKMKGREVRGLFKMHKAERPTVARLLHHHSGLGASLLGVPEYAEFRRCALAVPHQNRTLNATLTPLYRDHLFTQHFLKSTSPLPRCPPLKEDQKKKNTTPASLLHSFPTTIPLISTFCAMRDQKEYAM